MTDYCSLDEALSLLAGVTLRDAVDYDAGPPIVAAVAATEPSLSQAQSLLSAVGAEIDMHLRGKGYEIPVTDPDALASLKTICMNGAASKIAKSRWPADAGPGGDRGVAMMLRDDYQGGLAFIDAGGLLPDSASEGAAPTFNHGFPTAAERADAEPQF